MNATPASGRQIAKGAAWMFGFKLLDKSIALISTLLLARVLTPTDFGLVAMATAVYAFAQLMSAFGFDSALIQRKDVTRTHFETAWTFNVIFGIAIAAVLIALAFPMAKFYGDERLTPILMIFALAALIGGFENIGTVWFRKELDYRSEFKFLLAKRVVGFLVTIALALGLRSYWALVVGPVIAQVLSVWLSYYLHPFRPRLNLAARDDLMHFSKWIFASSLINFITGRSTDFILGRTAGPHSLGIYNMSYEIATMPSTEMIAPLNRAVFPAYSKLAVDPEQLRVRFCEVFGIICLVSVPTASGLFSVADAFVHVVLGSKWLETVPLIQILAFCGLVGALQSNLYLVVVALGKPQANTVLSAALLVVILPLFVWSSLTHGVYGLAIAMQVHALLALAGMSVIFTRIAKVKWQTILLPLARPALGSALMIVCLLSMDRVLTSEAIKPLVRLVILIGMGTFIYIGFIWGVWKLRGSPLGAEQVILSTVREQLLLRLKRDA